MSEADFELTALSAAALARQHRRRVIAGTASAAALALVAVTATAAGVMAGFRRVLSACSSVQGVWSWRPLILGDGGESAPRGPTDMGATLLIDAAKHTLPLPQ